MGGYYFMMSDWELILTYIRLQLEAGKLPKWGHYELMESKSNPGKEDSHNTLKAMNCNYNNSPIKKRELKKEWERNFMIDEKGMRVGELIQELEKIPEDKIVKLSVNWDHCDHVQTLKTVYHSDLFKWITLDGGE